MCNFNGNFVMNISVDLKYNKLAALASKTPSKLKT